MAVHPHACGDYALLSYTLLGCGGPSPRVWGLPQSIHLLPCHRRSIPTRVGTTCRWRSGGRRNRSIPTRVGTTSRPETRRQVSSVHPHACGDYPSQPEPIGTNTGPSPRVWGLPGLPGDPPPGHRSIPTRVGTTPLLEGAGGAFPVHPHACGDYSASLGTRSESHGPSPRVWGLLASGERQEPRHRSIPTRVGTTSTWTANSGRIAVHPHACGDYEHLDGELGPNRGPSPRVWGLRWGLQRAGQNRGPSPRVWGLHAEEVRNLLDQRSIPTRVGTTGGGT